MKIKSIAIDKVTPYPGNPRKVSSAAIAKVAASIAKFGFQQPLVVDRDMMIIVGHTRLQAAQSLGLRHVPVVVADTLTDAQARAYRIADNRVGAEAEFDRAKLIAEMLELAHADYAMAALGFDDAELSSLMAPPRAAQQDDRPGPVIAYRVFFETAADQEAWFGFLRWLKAEMPQDTITGRLTQFAQDHGYTAGSTP